MKISDIEEQWNIDCEINQHDLGESAARVPKLHAKYVSMLASTKLQIRKFESTFFRLRKTKERYYRGELTQQELQERGWDQYQGIKPLKTEMDGLIQSDDDIIAAVDKIEYYKTMAFMLDSILKSIHSRTWDIKSAIEWKKWVNGG